MIHHGPSESLLVFGGFGPQPTGPTQPGAEYEGGNEVYTNELHIFNLREEQWSSPAVTGRRPSPCRYFILTMVDDYRAVLFGGDGRGAYLNHLYVLDIARMHWSQVDDDKGGPWPDRRIEHAAVCLGFGGDHPQLLITGGLGYARTLGDTWTLDLRSWRWREVKGHSLKKRYGHSAAAFILSQEVTEVIMFGGRDDDRILLADTTVLRFEWLKQPTRNGPPTKEWVLTDTATGSQLGAEQRVRKKEEIITSADGGERAFLKAIDSLLAKGDNISRKLAHCVISGPTGSGKSSLLKRLLRKRLKKFSKSTGIIESMVFVDMNEINPTTFHSATAVDFDLWKEVDYDVSLVSQIGQRSTTTTPSSTQLPADSKPLEQAQGVPPGEDVTLKQQEQNTSQKKLETVSHSTTGSVSSQQSVNQQRPLALVVVSSDNVLAVIRKHGYQAFKEYLKKTSSLYLRDTGGQVEFQEMLPLLIFGPSIFLFVFRADLDFQSKLSFQYRESEDRSLNCYTSSITTEEALLQFLASVYAMDTSGKDVIKTHKSLVFIVGTHIDQLGSSAVERLEQLNRHIDSVIKENGFHDLVQYSDEDKGSVIFPVDNTSDSDQNFCAICSKVNSLVSHRKEFTIEYPTSFLLFCLDLQKVKKAILSLDEFKALAAQHGIEGQQVFTLLYFLHLRVGVVRYFNVDGLQDIVVLQPQVLFNTITTLIVKTFSCNAVPSREKLEFKKKGLLSTTAFESVISAEQLRPSGSSLSNPLTGRVTSDSSEEEMKKGIVPASAFETITIDGDLSPKKFLQLLVQLRIIAPFPTAENQEQKYFIPCVLNHVPESSQGDHPHTDVLPLAVMFKCQHSPKGIFGVLVTHLMIPSSKREITFTLLQSKIFKDQVFFTVHTNGDQDTISLRVYSSHLEIKFFPESLEDRASPVSTVCQNIREIIVASIDESLKDLHYSREKLGPFMCLKCESCSEFHLVSKGEKLHKIHCNKTLRSSRLPAQGRCWYNEGEPSPGVGSTGSVTEASGHRHQPEIDTAGQCSSKTSDEDLQTTSQSGRGAVAEASDSVPRPPMLTMADHYTVTRHLRDLSNDDVIELGEALGLFYPHLRKMDRLLKDMVAAWLNREDNVWSSSGTPSWTSLTKALRDINQPGIAQKIKEEFNHPGVVFCKGSVTWRLTSAAASYDGLEDFGVYFSYADNSFCSSIELSIFVCLSGPFELPDGFESASPAYLICPDKIEFQKEITIRMQHYAILQNEEDCENMSFLTASSTPEYRETGPVYVFKEVQGAKGVFRPGNQVGEIKLKHFCFCGLGRRRSTGNYSYSARLYRSISPHQGEISAVFCMCLNHGKYTEHCDDVILRNYTGLSGRKETQSYSIVSILGDKVELRVKERTGLMCINFDKTPQILKREIHMIDDGTSISDDYPPRLAIYVQSDSPTTTLPELHVLGVDAECHFYRIPVITLSPALCCEDHVKVVKYLKDLSNQEITNIGVRLGLHYARLKRMSCESLMDDMVLAWLRKDDDVGEISGDPSWKSFCTALKECGHTGIASTIQRKETLRDLG